jgi:hypothetical protein
MGGVNVMKYEIYRFYFDTRQAIYYCLPMRYVVKKYERLAGLELAMLRHPAKVSADTYDQVADHVMSLAHVINYREFNNWTLQDLKTMSMRLTVIFLIVLVLGLVGGLE